MVLDGKSAVISGKRNLSRTAGHAQALGADRRRGVPSELPRN